MIGIIGAMKVETDGIIALMSEKQCRSAAGCEFTVGNIGTKEVVVATCGIGKVFASICAQTMILLFSPKKIINVGVAGALSPKLGICDIVIADKALQHDMDTSPLGDPRGMISGINRIYFESDTSLRDELFSLAAKLGIKAHIGTVASGDVFVADPKIKMDIQLKFDAIACEMEGGAIAHTCFVNNVPFCILRSISDGVAADGAMDYSEFCEAAAKQSTRLIKAYIG